jgi:hypothetical protein
MSTYDRCTVVDEIGVADPVSEPLEEVFVDFLA